jgi:hypothetical protein
MNHEPISPVTEVPPEWREAFHEPQTLPAGWDLSEMLGACHPEVEDEAEERPEPWAAPQPFQDRRSG